MAGMRAIGRLSPDRYAAGLKAFQAAYETGTESHYQPFGAMVPDSTLCEAGADVRVLAIGSGSGEADSNILKKLLQNHKSVYNRVVEPSETIEGYKTLVGTDKSLGAVKCDWRQQTADEYFQTKEDTKFHLIHAIHCLYLVEDLHVTLRNMWEQLADGGYMLVGMDSEKGDWGKLQVKFWDDFGQGDRLKSSLRLSSDVKQWLDARGIRYVTRELETIFNVTECFKEDPEAGKLLLDFFTQTPDISRMLTIGRLNLSPDRYAAGLKAFQAAYETGTESHYQSFGAIVPDSTLCEAGADVRVLAIGSGSGEADSNILKKLLQNHKSVYNRVVEPSETIEDYKTLVGTDKSLGAVKCDWRQQTAEEYFQTKGDTKFHLIHAIHCLYHVEDLHTTLWNMWEQLTDGGYMLVGMESENSDWAKLWYKLWDDFGQGDRLKTSSRTSGDVKQWLDARGIRYVTHESETIFNVTECFKEGSEAGMLLLDFFTQTPDISRMLTIGRLNLSPDRYEAGMRVFQAAYETGTESHYQSFGAMVPDSTLCEAGADVRVLAIGSGSGEADINILKKLLQNHKSVYNRVVEPSETIEGYKTLVGTDKSLGAVKCDWRQQTAEEYFQTKGDTKFHLIHAIHCLYHVEDLHTTLRNMWEQLVDGGYMLVGMDSESDWTKLWYKLWDDFGQGDRLKTVYRTSGDVKQWLDARGIKYVTEEAESFFNVTECFKEGSEAGKLLLDFLTQTPDISSRRCDICLINQRTTVLGDSPTKPSDSVNKGRRVFDVANF
ncbi:HNMT [Branchiostoma lanceolatum]|uniref:HNMT protein n=1 Tax=Branchiostoma lanceolatum TaxID=7740 RepID=A0A8K0EQH3_BRALA|nr:HNMT [Branchiostoma lanceolatum]